MAPRGFSEEDVLGEGRDETDVTESPGSFLEAEATIQHLLSSHLSPKDAAVKSRERESASWRKLNFLVEFIRNLVASGVMPNKLNWWNM